MKILKTKEGKVVRIDHGTDICLYEAPVNPPNTGTKYTSGTDLYAHKTKNRNWCYYLYSWSMWQGCEERYELISKEEAIDYLISTAELSGWAELPDDYAEKAVTHFGYDIFEETA